MWSCRFPLFIYIKLWCDLNTFNNNLLCKPSNHLDSIKNVYRQCYSECKYTNVFTVLTSVYFEPSFVLKRFGRMPSSVHEYSLQSTSCCHVSDLEWVGGWRHKLIFEPQWSSSNHTKFRQQAFISTRTWFTVIYMWLYDVECVGV